MTTIEINNISVFVIAFCVILGSENVYLYTKIFFSKLIRNWDSKHVYSGGHFGKNDCHDGQILNLRIYVVFFVLLGSENVCLDTKICFLREL